MVPWPIALLAVFYGILTATSAAMAWQSLTGAVERSLVWPLAWLALSMWTMFGLALLKSWARRLAIIGSLAVACVLLAMAGLLILGGEPGGGFLATIAAGTQVVVIRYLRRPMVRAYFGHATT